MSWAVNLAVVIVQRLTGILADAIKLRHLVVKLIGNINSPSLPVVQVITPHCYTPQANQSTRASLFVSPSYLCSIMFDVAIYALMLAANSCADDMEFLA